MTPAVSVIMNCLNCARELPEALESVRGQTFQDLEIIFWDNGSTDESAAIARAYGPQLRYFRGERTVPLGAARNLALAEARGRYVAFLDCDDLWRPGKLEAQVALFGSNARVGLVCTDTEIIDGGRVLSRVFARSAPGRGMVFGELMTRQWISMSSAMIRREGLAGLRAPGGRTPPARMPRGTARGAGSTKASTSARRRIFSTASPMTGSWTMSMRRSRSGACMAAIRPSAGSASSRTRPCVSWKSTGGSIPAMRRSMRIWCPCHGREGRNAEARETVRPWRASSPKYRLFWAASHLPGACFDLAARLYFALPAFLRR